MPLWIRCNSGGRSCVRVCRAELTLRSLPRAGFEEFCRDLDSRFWSIDAAILRRVDSTNRLAGQVARELARDEIPLAPTAFVAWDQSAGRGRQGRSWESSAGLGVYVSILCTWSDPARLQSLPVLVPLVLAESLDPYLPIRCRLDWPNDLLVGGRKIGGVLIEAGGVAGSTSGWAVVGFGLNHGHAEEQLPLARATSLRLQCSDHGLPKLGVLAARLIERLWAELQEPPGPEVVRDYAERSIYRPGDQIRCRVAQRELTGDFVGFDPLGSLQVLCEGRIETIRSGEIIET